MFYCSWESNDLTQLLMLYYVSNLWLVETYFKTGPKYILYLF